MRQGAPFLNRLFAPGNTLQELHAALHQLVALHVDEIGAGLAVLRDENRLATALEVIEQFGGLALQSRDEFGSHTVILEYHSVKHKAVSPNYQVQRPHACDSARGRAAPRRALRSSARGRAYGSRRCQYLGRRAWWAAALTWMTPPRDRGLSMVATDRKQTTPLAGRGAEPGELDQYVELLLNKGRKIPCNSLADVERVEVDSLS